MSEYKGIVFDIDGTAVPDGAMEIASERLIHAFRELPSDVVAIAATSRIRDHALPIARQLGLHHGLIATNGAEVLDCSSGETIWSRNLSTDQVLGILGICGSLEYQLALEGDPLDQILYASDQNARECAGAFLLNVPFTVASDVRSEISSLPDAYAYISSGWSEGPETFDVNIFHSEAGKHCALRYLAGKNGLKPDDFIGVGDGVNDIPFLSIVGHAIAVANAHPEVLAEVDEIVPSQANDGLAYVLEKYFI